MPIFFIGHGSPMNAVADNSYTQMLTRLGKKIHKPQAILVISAHWMTQGTWITEMKEPKTIHDFYGFPDELYKIQYPAPGRPELAKSIQKQITEPQIHGDLDKWGLDHGTWSVLRHMFPEANIPVLQLSLDMTQPHEFHFQLGQKLNQLRKQEVLIIGSGNIVHNLRKIERDINAKPYDWAIEFDEWIKDRLEAREFSKIVNNFADSEAGRLSVPTLEHYYPLHYILGASESEDLLKFEYEGIQNASISMRCISFGFE